MESNLLAWIILLPLIGATVNMLLGRFFPKMVVNVIACGTVLASFFLAFFTTIRVVNLSHGAEGVPAVTGSLFPWDWMWAGGSKAFTIDWGLIADPLTTVMLLVITFIGFLIHVYSTGYMHEEKRYSRFFCYLNLFTGFMLLLVLSKNLLGMFVGWEGVGLCSYLLIGFWFDDKEKGEANSMAGMKAFIVNRIGDWGFTIGMLLLFVTIGSIASVWTLDIGTLRDLVLKNKETFTGGLGALICILLFVGATGKSAQIPLYVWLPDAMAGPTPVSALIHAATMVTAGVYMVCRMSFLFQLSAVGSTVVAVVGACTALFAALIAFSQNDIKKVLAYSTVSQLGFMFLAAGVGAYSIAIFHVMTHACFKACLFLGSGSVIHGCHHEQDMREMGGLWKKMPITARTFAIATLALAGVPFFSGFFSKDEIMLNAFTTHLIVGGQTTGIVLYCVAGLAAIGTAFYMSRCFYMTFLGEYRGHAHPHETPWTMYVPLIVLAVLSLVAGYFQVPLAGIHAWDHYLHHTFFYVPPHEVATSTVVTLLFVAVVMVAIGGGLGYLFFWKRKEMAKKFVDDFPTLHQASLNKFYVDERYQQWVVEPLLDLNVAAGKFDTKVIDGAVNLTGTVTDRTSRGVGLFDNEVVDGSVNGVADIVMRTGGRVRRIQTGNIRMYITLALLGAVMLIAVFAITVKWSAIMKLFGG